MFEETINQCRRLVKLVESISRAVLLQIGLGALVELSFIPCFIPLTKTDTILPLDTLIGKAKDENR
jgi:hypothetical protein